MGFFFLVSVILLRSNRFREFLGEDNLRFRRVLVACLFQVVHVFGLVAKSFAACCKVGIAHIVIALLQVG